MIGGPTGHLRHNTRKAQPPQIQLVDKHVDRPHRIVFTYVIVEELGEQNALPAVLPFDKALRQDPELIHQDSNPTNVFTQPGPEPPNARGEQRSGIDPGTNSTRAAVKITLTLDIDVEAAGEIPADAEASCATTLGTRGLRSSALRAQ